MSSSLPPIDPNDRRVYFVPHLAAGLDAPDVRDSDQPDSNEERRDVGNVRGLPFMAEDPAGLVISSRLAREGTGDMHAPVIDLDLPCRLVPSATPGHFHLYLDVAMPWPKYARLLDDLADAGLVQRGYVQACVGRGTSDVRAYPDTKPTEPGAPA